MPKVSVIIPAFNCEKYIGQTIESVLSQTYRDFELIVVDDGSTDNTKEVVKDYLRDKRIKYIYQNNSGISAARNNGFAKSYGEYIAFLDSDDLWYPNKLEEQVRLLDMNQDIGLTNCTVNYVDENSNVIGKEECKVIDDVTDLLFKGNPVTGSASAVMLRRTCLEKVGLFDIDLFISGDVDMWIRNLLHFKMSHMNRILAALRKYPSSHSSNIARYERDLIRMLDKFFSLNTDFPKKKKNFIYSYNYINLARTYLKRGSFFDFLRTSIFGIKLCPLNILYLLRLPRKYRV